MTINENKAIHNAVINGIFKTNVYKMPKRDKNFIYNVIDALFVGFGIFVLSFLKR
jgi:hypothetical protein